jgi:hypothetical protein
MLPVAVICEYQPMQQSSMQDPHDGTNEAVIFLQIYYHKIVGYTALEVMTNMAVFRKVRIIIAVQHESWT